MKSKKFILPIVLVLVCAASLVYAGQQSSQASTYQQKVEELESFIDHQTKEAIELKDHAQEAAAQAVRTVNMAKQQAKDAQAKIEQLEKSLKNCKIGQ